MTQTTVTWQAGSAPAEIVEVLIGFDGDPEQFLLRLLEAQCRIGQATSGTILGPVNNALGPVAIYPQQAAGQTVPPWLATAMEQARRVLEGGRSTVTPLRLPDDLYGVTPDRHLVMIPFKGGGGAVRGIGAFVVMEREASRLEQCKQRLELTVCLLSLYEMRLTLARRQADLSRIKRACEILVGLNQQQRFKAAAMALCNHLASHWQADRVCVGLIHGRAVKAAAMSHAEKFTRKMELIQAVEATMEECADQDVEVFYPAEAQATTVNRSMTLLAQRFGPANVLAMPLRNAGKIIGVVTMERPVDRPFLVEDVEALRLAMDLVSVRVLELSEHDRWFWSRWGSAAKRGAAKLVGPTHTWAKAAGVAAAIGLGWAVIGQGTYRVEGSFQVQAVQKQILSAPYEGYLLKVHVEPGVKVEAGKTVLAELEASQMRLEMAEAMSQRAGQLKQAEISRREDKIAEAQAAEYEAERLAARVELLKWKIEQAMIRSPVDGVVLTGDLRKQLGSPLQLGQALFEVAPLESLRADLAVAEDYIADVRVGQKGEMAAISHPSDRIAFTVEQIDPVAKVVEQRNVFNVRLRLERGPEWLRPGMEGVGKIDVEERSWAYIWTRDLINWIRMKLWL
jgi:multidrug resistance efflux pump